MGVVHRVCVWVSRVLVGTSGSNLSARTAGEANAQWAACSASNFEDFGVWILVRSNFLPPHMRRRLCQQRWRSCRRQRCVSENPS